MVIIPLQNTPNQTNTHELPDYTLEDREGKKEWGVKNKKRDMDQDVLE